MASTDQVREWYQETILNHDQRGTSGYEPQCDWRSAVTVRFPNQSGGHYSEPVHPATEDAWKVYARLMDLHGVEMSGAGGVNQCRNIAGTNWPSLHAYLVACDLPPNSYKPQAFIDDVLKVRTNSGAQVFLNGAIFDDRMHDQINCSQQDLATGIDPDSLPFGEEMVSRNTKADDGIPSLADNFDEAVSLGIMSEHTQPGGVAFNDEFATFLKRAGVFEIADLKRRIAELERQSGSGGLTEAQVKALINDSQIIAP